MIRRIHSPVSYTHLVVKEWLEAGGLYPNPTLVHPEVKYGNTRMDFYIEDKERKAFIAVSYTHLDVYKRQMLLPDQ